MQIKGEASIYKIIKSSNIKKLFKLVCLCILVSTNTMLMSSCSDDDKTTVSIYSTGGKLMMKQTLENGEVNMGNLQPGVYAVQVNTGDKSTTGSTLIRL